MVWFCAACRHVTGLSATLVVLPLTAAGPPSRPRTSGDGPNYEGFRTLVNSIPSASSTTETLRNRYLSQGVRPALTLSIGLVTVGTALAGHLVLHANVSFSLLISLGILSVVIPRCRAVVAAVHCALYGLVLLVVCTPYAIVTGKDPGDYLTGVLAKVVQIVHGYVPASESMSGSGASQEGSVRSEAVSPATSLPSAANIAEDFPEPVFFNTLQVMAEQRPDGQSEGVQAAPSPVPLRRGRHAKSDHELAASA
jgi:hypothetical protein